MKEFPDAAFSYVGPDVDEHVKIDPKYFRPTEVEVLISDPEKAPKNPGWNPQIRFDDLVRIMMNADMRAIGLVPTGDGDRILKKAFPKKWWKKD